MYGIIFNLSLSLHSFLSTVGPGTDIRIRNTSAASGGPRVRPRGTGKLLTTIDSIGLALLRLEHVLAVEKGESQFYIDTPSGDTFETSNSVIPWRPDWWPELRPATE